MIETTQRVRGLFGTVHCGTAAGGTQVDAGGEVREWSVDISVSHEDAGALSDLDYVGMVVSRQTKVTFTKLVLTPTLKARILEDPVVYVALYLGRSQTATTGNGALAIKGLVILDSVSLQNQRGPVLENVSGTFTGAISES